MPNIQVLGTLCPKTGQARGQTSGWDGPSHPGGLEKAIRHLGGAGEDVCYHSHGEHLVGTLCVPRASGIFTLSSQQCYGRGIERLKQSSNITQLVFMAESGFRPR